MFCGMLLWEPYPSYYNGLFSSLLVQRFPCQKGRSLSVLYEQYETFYLFYVSLSFLCNIICYLISVFVFSLVTLSGSIWSIAFLCNCRQDFSPWASSLWCTHTIVWTRLLLGEKILFYFIGKVWRTYGRYLRIMSFSVDETLLPR